MNFGEALRIAHETGNERPLRSIPEGRAYLLEIAQEWRKSPIRRAVKAMGARARQRIDKVMEDVLKGRKEGA